MGITLGSQFDVQTALPLDSRLVVADTTARDAISALQRYEGMIVYVTADGTNYQLVGGITNGDWTELSGGGGGGGVASLQFFESGVAPERAVENQIEVYKFDVTAVGQNLYAVFKVPSSYVVGTQILLRMLYYSPDTSGTVLIRSQTTMLSTAADEVTSTTNQRTSTNSAQTMSGSIDNVVLPLELDLTDATGNVNSVPVGTENLMKVRLYRDTDTATSNVRIILNSMEVIF